MFRLSMFWFVLFMLTACMIPTSTQAVDQITVVDNVLEYSLSMQIYTPNGWRTIGSGVAVKKYGGLLRNKEHRFGILTARHVAEAIDIRTARACSVVAEDQCVSLSHYIAPSDDEFAIGNDWAVYPVSSLPKQVRPAKIAPRSAAKIGEDVTIVGHPWGQFMVTYGKIGALRSDFDDAPYLVLHAWAAPGNSGGGCFDHYGRLLGLVVAIDVDFDPIAGRPHLENNTVFVVPVTAVVF